MEFIGSVYKLTSPNTDKCYVGSTKSTLRRRLNHHISTYKMYCLGRKVRQMSAFDIIKAGDVSITLLEEVKFSDPKVLSVKEGEWIQKTDCVNKLIAGGMSPEDRIQRMKEHRKKWRDNNVDRVRSKGRERMTCECGMEVSKANIISHRHRALHRERISKL